MQFPRSLFVVVVVQIAFNGCSEDSDGRQAVSGAVNVDGAPVPAGSISFQPAEGQATSSGAVITKGKYKIPQDSGLLAGKYRVAISAPMPGAAASAPALPGEAGPPVKDMIPPEWNTASTQFIEVKKGGSNAFPFEISTKSGAAKPK